MAVAGIVTVLKWDQVLPGHTGLSELRAAAGSPPKILLANAMAITIGMVVVAFDVSTVPSVLFPMLVMAAAEAPFFLFLQFVAAHAISVLLASVFSICFAFAILGGLSADPAARYFPRVRLLGTRPDAVGVHRAAPDRLWWRRHGSRLATLSRFASSLSSVVVVPWAVSGPAASSPCRAPIPPGANLYGGGSPPDCCSVCLELSQKIRRGARRHPSPADQRLFAAIIPVMDWFGERSPGFPRACHLFVIRALLRSEAHRLAIAVSIGLGWMLALPDLLRSSGAGLDESVLAVPLEMAYLLILGLRVAFELPASVSANWIFRVILDSRETEPLRLVRRVVLAFLTPLVLAPSLIYSCWRWGPLTG